MAKSKKPNGNIGGTLGFVAGIVGAVTSSLSTGFPKRKNSPLLKN